MTTCRRSKPWRVVITGPDGTATSDHSSEDKAYAHVRGRLGEDGPADTARVEHWEDGRWRWIDTMTKEELG